MSKFSGPALKGRLLFHHAALVSVWSMRFATILPLMEQGLCPACFDIGDFIFAGYSSFNLVWLVLESGGSLEHIIEASRKYASLRPRRPTTTWCARLLRTRGAVRGEPEGCDARRPLSFNDDTYDEAHSVSSRWRRAGFGIGETFAFYISEARSAGVHLWTICRGAAGRGPRCADAAPSDAPGDRG